MDDEGDDDYLTLQQLHFEIDALKAQLRESQLDTKVGYRLYEAAEARILELRLELAEVLAERDAFQSTCTQAQRELARARALIEAVAVRCEVAAASFAAAETLPDNDATPTARALRMVVEQIGTLLRAALNA